MVRGQRLSGYTSYASLTDLPWRFPIFKDIVESLDQHVAKFAEDLQFDLGDRKLVLETSGSTSCPKAAITPPISTPFRDLRHNLAMPDRASACASKIRATP